MQHLSYKDLEDIHDEVKNKKMSLLSLEEKRLTSKFRQQVDSAARRIHSLLASKGSSGLDFELICEELGIDSTIGMEAIRRLDKLKRVQWVDESTVVLADLLKKI